jgi:hypothetical protein
MGISDPVKTSTRHTEAATPPADRSSTTMVLVTSSSAFVD